MGSGRQTRLAFVPQHLQDAAIYCDQNIHLSFPQPLSSFSAKMPTIGSSLFDKKPVTLARTDMFSMPSALQSQFNFYKSSLSHIPLIPYELLHRWLTRISLVIACFCMLVSFPPRHHWQDAALLTMLTVFVSLLTVRLPNSKITTYPNIPILLALVGLFGASTATLVAVLCIVTSGLVSMSPKNRFKIKHYVSLTCLYSGCFHRCSCPALCSFGSRVLSQKRRSDWRAFRLAGLYHSAAAFFYAAFMANAALVATLLSTREKNALGHYLA